MISNPNPTTFILLTFGILIFIFAMLLPSILELRKPKDAGPRIINGFSVSIPHVTGSIRILNMEEDQRFDQTLIEKIADSIAFLPNLEI
jgi:hypothetical protein